MAKRNRLEIIRDILIVIREKDGRIKPTHILYKSNLSHQMMEQYLKEMLSKGFIVEVPLEKGRSFSITEKGKNYLERYGMIMEFTESFGLGGEGEV